MLHARCLFATPRVGGVAAARGTLSCKKVALRNYLRRTPQQFQLRVFIRLYAANGTQM
jgi:hypothetical protein